MLIGEQGKAFYQLLWERGAQGAVGSTHKGALGKIEPKKGRRSMKRLH